VLIFSVGILLVLESLQSSFDATGSINDYTRAALRLQEKLDDLRCEDDLMVGADRGEFDNDELFRWETDISQTHADGLYEATVTIKWSRRKKLSATTYVLQQD